MLSGIPGSYAFYLYSLEENVVVPHVFPHDGPAVVDVLVQVLGQRLVVEGLEPGEGVLDHHPAQQGHDVDHDHDPGGLLEAEHERLEGEVGQPLQQEVQLRPRADILVHLHPVDEDEVYKHHVRERDAQHAGLGGEGDAAGRARFGPHELRGHGLLHQRCDPLTPRVGASTSASRQLVPHARLAARGGRAAVPDGRVAVLDGFGGRAPAHLGGALAAADECHGRHPPVLARRPLDARGGGARVPIHRRLREVAPGRPPH
mmetsp:Transcript_38343/g.121063  ORF Transcript_38343/g.121063 Transcript_38343/m.121063 type:complete len:259 (-) Transcript_38343:8878-9654(-)